MVTADLVERVKHRLQAGMTPTEIAADLHCARRTVRLIRAGLHRLQNSRPTHVRCPDCGGMQLADKSCEVCKARNGRAGRLLNPEALPELPDVRPFPAPLPARRRFAA